MEIWSKIKRGISLALCAFLVTQSLPAIDALAEETEAVYEEQDYMGLEEFEAIELQADEELIAEHEALVADYEELDELYIGASGQTSFWRKLGSNAIYNQLPSEDKAIWDELCAICEDSMTNGKTLSKVSGVTAFKGKDWNYVKNFAYRFVYSNPQYFFLKSSISGFGMGSDYYLNIDVHADFQDGAKRKTAAEKFQSTIQGWLTEINKYSLPVEKEKKAVEIICANTVYEDNSLSQSAYSMVCLGKTVCAGYAATFSILMNGSGIETQTITGTANNGQSSGGHAWNAVKLYDQWYITDVTWMDHSYIYYSRFNRADATIGGDRVKNDYWNAVYYPAKYDSGSSSNTYFNPYFTAGNYTYFTVNNSTTCGDYLARPIAANNGASASGVPTTVPFNSKTYKVTGKLDSSTEPIEPITYVMSLNASTLNLCVGTSSALSASYSPSKTGTTITWKSSDTSIATVDSAGKVTAVKAGTATITATDGTLSAKCTVTVRNHDYSSKKFTWNETNKTCKITYSCTYDSTHKVSYDCTITSEIRKKATCIAKGTTRYFAKYGTDSTSVDYEDIPIDANAHGVTTIVGAKAATTTVDGYTGDTVCSLCNKVLQAGTTIPRTGSIVSISVGTWTGCVGESKSLTATSSKGSGITWKSSNIAVATVDSTGKVKAIKAGTATITASDGSASASCTVTVRDHNYTGKRFNWNDSTKTCKIVYTCSYDGAQKSYDCVITSVVQTKATCSAMGVTRYTAKYGNDSSTKDYTDIPINADAHGATTIEGAKDATTAADGYTGDAICKLCGQIVKKGTVIPRILVGWNQENGKWRYYDSNSNPVVGWFKDTNGKWYYFDINGIMQNGWQKIDSKWYYFKSGAMVTGWQKINDVWYYFKSGAMVTGWQQISGKWYYFDGGAMVDGWKQISGKWYYFDDGAMQTSRWINDTYYVKANGVMATNEWISGKYYVDANGKYVPGKKK